MRAFVPAVILSLATVWAWLGGSGVSAEAAAPTEHSVYQPLGCAGQDQYTGQDESTESSGIFGGFLNSGGFLAPGDCGPRWIFAAEVVAIQRSATRSQLLFTNRTGTTQTDPINASSAYFPVEFGPKVSAVRRGPSGWELEAAYFQVDGFAAQAIVPGRSTLVTDANSGFAVNDGQFRYISALHWGELNLRQQWNDWLNLSVGFGMGELAERYRADGVGAVTPVPVSLDVNAINHLYGVHLGANAEIYNMGGPLRISVLCKAGAYGNSADQNIRRVQTGLSDELLTAQGNQAAFHGRAGGVLTYALSTHVAFRASAEAAWLEGVALAPEQIGATNFVAGTTRADTGGGVFYYGGGLGIECRY